MKPPSLPLSAPDGEVLAYACGLCRRVGTILSVLGAPSQIERARTAEFSEQAADDCCTCRTCPKVDSEIRGHECDACAKERDAKWEAEAPAREAEARRRVAVQEAALVTCLDRDAAAGLEALMSDTSENHYAAGWLSECEFSFWSFVLEGPGEWGLGTVDADTIAEMKRLSDKCGGWIAYRENVGRVFVPMAEWLPLYDAWKAKIDEWRKVNGVAS